MAHDRLSSLVAWSHRLLAEVLRPGDLAVDLTAGTGRDTLFLAHQVGPRGLVVACDIQPKALLATEERLEQSGLTAIRCPAGTAIDRQSGVVLVHGSHDLLAGRLSRTARGIIANLGYLPGGDPSLITRPGTTREAVAWALGQLVPGGRMVIVVYLGHPGGAEESEVLEAQLGQLSSREWDILRLQLVNRRTAPYLLLAERL